MMKLGFRLSHGNDEIRFRWNLAKVSQLNRSYQYHDKDWYNNNKMQGQAIQTQIISLKRQKINLRRQFDTGSIVLWTVFN